MQIYNLFDYVKLSFLINAICRTGAHVISNVPGFSIFGTIRQNIITISLNMCLFVHCESLN